MSREDLKALKKQASELRSKIAEIEAEAAAKLEAESEILENLYIVACQWGTKGNKFSSTLESKNSLESAIASAILNSRVMNKPIYLFKAIKHFYCGEETPLVMKKI